MASRKTTTKKAAKAAPKRARKPAEKVVNCSRGHGKTSAQEDHIRKLIASGQVKVVKVASFGQDLDAIRRGVEPTRTLQYIDIPAERYEEFLSRLNGGGPKVEDRETDYHDSVRRKLEEWNVGQAAKNPEPRITGIGDHTADAMRYGIGAMAQSQPATGLRSILSQQDTSIAALAGALDDLRMALSPVLAEPHPAVDGTSTLPERPSEFEALVGDHNDRIDNLNRIVRSLTRRLSL